MKDLLEWYLVQEKYPSVGHTQASANAPSYIIKLNTPDNISTYIPGANNNGLVEVGTTVTVNEIKLTEYATHTGISKYTGTPGSITGMTYFY